MQLPVPLQTAITNVTESLGLHQLIDAREELTKRYRQPFSGSQFMTNDAQRQSYVISRMPATYAALQSALYAIRERTDLNIKSLLDLGAGPGTAMWAACHHFPDIETITLIEKDKALLNLGKQLTEFSEYPVMHKANWLDGDLETIHNLPSHDLVILSYSIGELNPQRIHSLLNLCWNAAKQLILVVEPGTPIGFERIRLIRRQLIDEGAHLIAPCPHQTTCPMQERDWCHFTARVERTALHRRLKGGSLGYEDEKFSYIAASKFPVSMADSRILTQPDRHSGHIILKLCTPHGLQYSTISKKMGHVYKLARKSDWGDAFPKMKIE